VNLLGGECLYREWTGMNGNAKPFHPQMAQMTQMLLLTFTELLRGAQVNLFGGECLYREWTGMNGNAKPFRPQMAQMTQMLLLTYTGLQR